MVILVQDDIIQSGESYAAYDIDTIFHILNFQVGILKFGYFFYNGLEFKR